jgi:hypothetical protein
MRVYEVDDGAAYWVAAPDLKGAVSVMSALYDDHGWPDSFTIDEMFEGYARKVMIQDEDTRARDSAWVLAQKASKAEVLGCSEWP